MKANSKEVVQGYVLTSAKYDFTRYEKLILYKMVEIAQADTLGKKLGPGYKVNRNLFNDILVEIPIKDFFPEGDKNHAQLKKALTKLSDKKIEYEDAKQWQLIRIVEKPKIQKWDLVAKFEVNPMIWDVILNFNKGHSRYELNAAMNFSTVYAMRFFELFYKNLKPQTLTIDTIRERFCKGKYPNRPADLIKNVIVSAKKELDQKSEYSFNFVTIKEGRKITKVKFVPYFIEANRNHDLYEKELKKKTSAGFDLSVEFIRALNDIGFSNQGVKNNLELFKEANQKIDLYGFLKNIARKASEAKNPPAYVVGSLKKHLTNQANFNKVDQDQRDKINGLLGNVSEEKSANLDKTDQAYQDEIDEFKKRFS